MARGTASLVIQNVIFQTYVINIAAAAAAAI